MSPKSSHSTVSKGPRQRVRLVQALQAAPALLLLLAVTVLPAGADDRDLFRAAAESPYVMMLLDTSGSMNAQLPGTVALGDQANPGARFYQAKAAVYDVVKSLDPRIRLGLAHFPQPGSEADRKHYLYKRAPGQPNPNWWPALEWPRETDHLVFGDFVVDGGNSNYLWCNSGTNVRDRLNSFPKLDDTGTVTTTIYTNNVGGNGERLRVRFTALPANTLGSPRFNLTINVTAINTDCSVATGGAARNQTATLEFEPAFNADVDGKPFVDTAGNEVAFDYFSRYSHAGIGTILDWTRFWDCGLPVQWEPNENNATGNNGNIGQFAYPTYTDPLGRDPADGAFDRGDVLPWDWVNHPLPTATAGFEHSTQNEILYRLAPNTRPDLTATPLPNGQYPPIEAYTVTGSEGYPTAANLQAGDSAPILRSAYYFEQQPVAGRLNLRAAYTNTPPIFIGIRTPLAGMMDATAAWYDEWEPFASDPVNGDPDFQCRERFAILLTDGAETCSGNPGNSATGLYNRGIRTFAVAFSSGVTVGSVQAIADNGGTGRLDLDSESPYDREVALGKNPPSGQNTNGQDCNDFNDFDPTTGDVVGFDFCLGYDVSNPPATIPPPTGGVIVASDKTELVAALTRLLAALQSTTASFSSAAVPAAQVESEKSIFLTSFIPQDARSRWPGNMAHFIRPLPTTTNSQGNQVPDFSRTCNASVTTSCLAWEARSAMLPQAPPDDPSTASWNDVQIDIDPTVVTAGVMRIANGQNRRRILYARERGNNGDMVGYPQRRFHPQPNLSREYDMWDGMGISYTPGNAASELAARKEAAKVMRDTVLQKVANDPNTGTTFNFILGDLFHSDPVQVGPPVRAEYLAANLPLGSNPDCTVSTQGYRCFFAKHRYRRQVVFAGANDGMVHAFDAGRFQSNVQNGVETGTYGTGGGRELFAYIPREELARLYDMKFNTSNRHEFSVDGPVRIDDVFIDPRHTGTPTVAEREWRSILIGGMREGGKTYYALDVTQPDTLTTSSAGEDVPTSPNYVPSCITNSYNTTACGPRRYGTTLWEFTDTPVLNNAGVPRAGNYYDPDLGNTWSQVNTGRIKVLDSSGNDEIKYVAIFGGGIDKGDPSKGNNLYMVDIETGRYIYKRPLDSTGGTPSEPAAVDTNGDSVLDTIYIGTYAGGMYKVDISTPVSVGTAANGDPLIQDTAWDPFKIIDTGGRPIFFAPTVIYVGDRGQYALAFGTGDREDLWAPSVASQEGRFFMVLDNNFASGMTPLVETDVEVIDNAAPAASTPQDFLITPNTGKEYGYVITLDPGEKVVTKTFALSGITAFSSFVPSSTAGSAGVCQRTGFGRVYTLFTTSGEGLQQNSVTSAIERFRQTAEPVFSNPFTETSATNTSGQSSATDLTQDLIRIRDQLRALAPSNCRWTDKTENILAVKADSGVEFIAPVPICVITNNWKEGPFN